MKLLKRNDYSNFWRHTHDWRMPLEPVQPLKCPICGGAVRYKEYSLQSRSYQVAGRQYRVDLWYKCCSCAYVWQHGVSVDKKYYTEIVEALTKKIGRIRPLHILEVIDLEKLCI